MDLVSPPSPPSSTADSHGPSGEDAVRPAPGSLPDSLSPCHPPSHPRTRARDFSLAFRGPAIRGQHADAYWLSAAFGVGHVALFPHLLCPPRLSPPSSSLQAPLKRPSAGFLLHVAWCQYYKGGKSTDTYNLQSARTQERHRRPRRQRTPHPSLNP